MTENVNSVSRDEVLLAFHDACERPTVQDLIEWTTKYPQFADEIREHAAILRDWDAQQGVPQQVPDELALTRARSRALSALHSARNAEPQGEVAASVTFAEMIQAKSTDLRTVARHMDIGVDVLGDMIDGIMLPPVGPRLVAAWTSFFAVTKEGFERALASAQASPSLGLAKASGGIGVVRRSYDDIVRSSTLMSEERRRYWLGET